MRRKYVLISFLFGLIYRLAELLIIDTNSISFFPWNPVIFLNYGLTAAFFFLFYSTLEKLVFSKIPKEKQFHNSFISVVFTFLWVSLALNLDFASIHGFKIAVTEDWFILGGINLGILLIPILILTWLSAKIFKVRASSILQKLSVIYICAIGAVIFILSIALTYLIPFNGKNNDGKPLNVILFSVDTLRKDHLSLYGYPRNTSPALDNFFQNSIIFNRCITAVPETAPSYTSIYTGTNIFTHLVISNSHDFNHERTGLCTIASELKKHGYYTSFHLTGSLPGTAANLEFGVDDVSQDGVSVIRSNGYNIYTLMYNLVSSAYNVLNKNEKPVDLTYETKNTIKWLNSRPQEPFFTHIYWHYPHSPYGDQAHSKSDHIVTNNLDYEPYPTSDPDTVRQIKKTRDLYDQDIYYTDMQFSAVIEAVKKNGYDRNSIIIFTGDHGEDMGERIRDGEPFFGHSFWLYESSTDVPLLIHLPHNLDQGLRTDIPVSTIDIAPTIFSLLGLSQPATFEGELF